MYSSIRTHTVLFKLVAQIDKTSRTHARIIWSCSWSHDDVCFATASRDKKVHIPKCDAESEVKKKK